MATQYSIPSTPQDAVNAGRMIIRTFGLGHLKTQAFIMPPDKGRDVPSQISKYPSYTSFLGSAVFSDLDISPNESKLPRIQMPVVLFNVTQSKQIITTSVQGRNGTVKEYISDGDYQINIKGVLPGYNNIYPDATSQGSSNIMPDFLRVLQLNKSLSVNSWYLHQFGIKEMVVTSYNFPQVEGQYATQAFEINAISDTPFEIAITQ